MSKQPHKRTVRKMNVGIRNNVIYDAVVSSAIGAKEEGRETRKTQAREYLS